VSTGVSTALLRFHKSLFYQGLYFYGNGLKIRVSAVQIHPWMHHAFSPRLDNALLSHGAGTENNTKELKSQKVNIKITNQNSKSLDSCFRRNDSTSIDI
jgi:hypothetical protein